MIARLLHPYPFERSAQRRVMASLLFGLFVFLFLFGFRPFGMAYLDAQIAFVALIFGLICTVSMLFLGFVVVELFPDIFDERRWTVWKEVAWALFHVVFIGLINALFAASVGMCSFTLGAILIFLWYTFIIGIFPVTVSILVTEMQLNRKYRMASAELSGQLSTANERSETAGTVVLESDNRNEDLTIHPDTILYVEGADNYVEVVFRENGSVKKHLLRATLKSVEETLPDSPLFLRVHKSYVVNSRHIERISGNAQGYRLHIAGVEEPVPVSRRQNNLLREALNS